jgi:hypothetical protein
MDPDPAFFVIDLQDANKKTVFSPSFSTFTFEGTSTLFFEDKK